MIYALLTIVSFTTLITLLIMVPHLQNFGQNKNIHPEFDEVVPTEVRKSEHEQLQVRQGDIPLLALI